MTYQFIILPVIAALITQIIKFLIRSNKLKVNWRNIIAYSGMPSGHATVTVSLATIIGLNEGAASPLFALSIFFCLMTLRDALGLRQYLGQHGEVINELVEDLDEDQMLDRKYPELKEKIGHNLLQILVGAFIGFLVSYLGFYYWL